MSHHQFTTPRVVYLGQTYRGRNGSPASQTRAPRGTAAAGALAAKLPQESWGRPVSSPAANR